MHASESQLVVKVSKESKKGTVESRPLTTTSYFLLLFFYFFLLSKFFSKAFYNFFPLYSNKPVRSVIVGAVDEVDRVWHP